MFLPCASYAAFPIGYKVEERTIETRMSDVLSPKISIILTNYNDGELLPTALEAICEQSPHPDEVIVVDDGSSDNSVEVINGFCRKHTFVSLVQHTKNMGVQAAGSSGLDHSTGDYIGWFAADDQILPGFLKNVQAAILNNPGAGVIFGDVVVIAGDAPSQNIKHRQFQVDELTYFGPQSLRRILRERYIWIAPNAAVIRRDALVASGGWHHDLEWLSDWFAAYTVALRYGVVYVPYLSGNISYRPDSYSKSAQSDLGRQREVFKALFRILSRPDFKDIRHFIKLAPILLLQPLGPRILWSLALSWSTWDIFIPTLFAKICFSVKGRWNLVMSR